MSCENKTKEKTFRVGSRKSQLALIQTNFVIKELLKQFPDYKFEITTITTYGDKVLDIALSKIGEKSLFTKELEIALQEGRIDFVVHSLKDLPSTLPDGLVIGAICERDDERDAVVMHPKYKNCTLATLPKNSVVGTSALRRSAQLTNKYPSLQFQDIRGNLNSRLKKLDESDDYACLVLAKAGLDRMGWQDRITEVIDPETCMYAISQGAIAVECLQEDIRTLKLLESINHTETMLRCVAERGFLRKLEVGCSVPVACNSVLSNSTLNMKGGVFSIDGKVTITGSVEKTLQYNDEPPQKKVFNKDVLFSSAVSGGVSSELLKEAENCGTELACELLDKGAEPIVAKAKEELKKAILERKNNSEKKNTEHKNGLDSNESHTTLSNGKALVN